MKISEIIESWYKKNKRDLPWRRTSDPYKIWLSEVILQQTRVSQGLSYYLRFTEKWPDVHSLAAANEEEVMKVWQGLGYYSRARNLHFAAKQVVEEFDGVFPSNYKDLLRLKGVGNYTAAAVVSIVYGESIPVVDGNVARVISRLFAIEIPVNSREGEKQVQELALELLNQKHPGDHNQAMMEFGALQCKPGIPSCGSCPLQHHCNAYASGMVEKIPVKQKKKSPVTRYFYYFIIRSQEHIFIRQRTGNDIWRKLYEFPLLESPQRLKEENLLRRISPFIGRSPGKINISNISQEIRHQLTHRTIVARFIHIEIAAPLETDRHRDWVKVSEKELNKYPLPRLIDRYLEVLK